MLNHYADHETEGDRETIQATQKEIFEGLIPKKILLPQKVLLLEYKGNPDTAAA
jgi:hypothetical protein